MTANHIWMYLIIPTTEFLTQLVWCTCLPASMLTHVVARWTPSSLVHRGAFLSKAPYRSAFYSLPDDAHCLGISARSFPARPLSQFLAFTVSPTYCMTGVRAQ